MVEVHISEGTVRGAESAGIARFLGIPYAAPPFGKNRLAPPAPPTPWEGVRDALDYGPTAPKGDYPAHFQPLLPEQNIPGEDCLNLNIWTPTDALGSGALPVLVWIHGGSFMNGSGSVGVYDGSRFARDGIVCVTINYRLGAEGFLFTQADLGSGSANRGLQDQIAALRWVQQNISKFGGDPARVTVAGESAGAMSLTTLMAMPSAAGLFAQAIPSSGSAAHTLTPEVGLTVGRAFAQVLGVEPEPAAIATVDLDIAVKAASDMVADIQSTPDVERWGLDLVLSMLPFAPVIDGVVLPQHPLEAFASGAANDVSVLIGSNSQEARLFLVAPGVIDAIDETGFVEGARPYGITDAGLDAYRSHYRQASPGDRLAQVVTDWFFGLPAIRQAEARERGGATTWVYRFDRPAPQDNNGLGAAHAVEIAFAFDNIDHPEAAPLSGATPSQEVADTIHGTWVRFIKDGDPGWAPYTQDRRTTGILTETVTIVDDPDADLRQTWDGIR